MGDDLKGMDVLIFSQMFTKDCFLARFVISGIIFEEVSSDNSSNSIFIVQ